MEVYFDDFFNNKKQMISNATRLKLINEKLNIILGEGNEKNLESVKRELLELLKPNEWNVFVEGNLEKAMEVDFNKFATVVTETTGLKLEEISVFRFYSVLGYLQEKNKKQ